MSSVGIWIKRNLQPLSIGLVGFLLLSSYLFLPLAFSSHFASPDEMAFAVVTDRFSQGKTALMPDLEAIGFPWLHPRSWVSLKAGIVPVGFLGVPGLFVSFFGFAPSQSFSVFAALVIVSSAWALYLLLKPRFGHWPALVGVVICFFFPTWLYYGNRSLFANGLQLSFFIWSLCLLDQLPFGQRAKSLFFGMVAGLGLAMRPFELIWMLPVWIWWVREHRDTTKLVWIFIGVVIGCVPAILLATLLYGSPLVFGYWLPGNPMPTEIVSLATTSASIPLLPRVLPYGIHPRSMWWNIKSFGLEILWPWLVLGIASLIAILKDKRSKINWTLVGLIAWSGFILVTVYGSGIYQDHVGVGLITIGNSFLRYLMPLTLIVSLGAAVAVRSVGWEGRLRKLGIGLVVIVMAGLGGWMAFVKDDEGLVSVRRELIRYDNIAADTVTWFAPGSVILSPRSDKVFFPRYRAVSPMPSRAEVLRYLRTGGTPIGYFDRTMTTDQTRAWEDLGVKVDWLKTFGNESLYRLSLLP